MLYYPMKNNITIHKKNELIRGIDDYSLHAKRALNAIYWAMQKHKRYSYDSMLITFTTLRKVMSLENDNRYIDTIKDALLELQKPMQLNNYTHPVTETHYSWYSEPVLTKVGFLQDDKSHKEHIVEVSVSTLVRHIMQTKGNFTPLDLIPITNQFRTKYAMKLYEYLKSFESYHYIDITHKHMMELLNLDEKSKYRYYSDLYILIERQLKQIVKKSDLKEVRLSKSKELSKDKIFRIVIRKDGVKNATIANMKKNLNPLIKRF